MRPCGCTCREERDHDWWQPQDQTSWLTVTTDVHFSGSSLHELLTNLSFRVTRTGQGPGIHSQGFSLLYVLVDTAQYFKEGTWWSKSRTSGMRCHCFSDEKGEEFGDFRWEPCWRKSDEPAAGPYDHQQTRGQSTGRTQLWLYMLHSTGGVGLHIHAWK